MRLGPRPRRVPLRRGLLHAAEIEAAARLRGWLSTRSEAFRDIALRGTWLDEEDVDALLGLALPGLDELAALLELEGLAASGRYDAIVVDTAPTGHTLRMLALPDTIARMAAVFDAMLEKHRAIVGALRGRWTPDAADDLVRELSEIASTFANVVRDETRTEHSWVTLPERMAVEETLDALSALHREGIRVGRVIVNRITPDTDSSCRFCAARRRFEQLAIQTLRSGLETSRSPRILLSAVADRTSEPRGVASLGRIASEALEISRLRRSGGRTGQRPVYALAAPGREPCETILFEGHSLILFGGKGGVGKTTCAAAAAIAAAEAARGRRVLLLSTDPAHSLGDVLGAVLSHDDVRVKGTPANLRVRELDARKALQRTRHAYAASIDALFDRLGAGGGVEVAYDRRVMHGLLDLAPPGLDELAAIVEVTAALAGDGTSRRWDLIVVDTAPTGHALRLLEMPELLQDWTRALMRIVLKYQPVAGAGVIGEQLLTLSKRLTALRSLLADAASTAFVVVTRAATLPMSETVRLLRALSRLGIASPALVVNAAGGGTCGRCRARRSAEARVMRAFGRQAARLMPPRVVVAPSVMPPPAAPDPLRRWHARWTCQAK